MRVILLFFLPFYFLADAQVKEINFLGMSWNLVGYDIRVKPRLYSATYYTEQFKNSEFPSRAYLEQYYLSSTFFNRDLVRSINTLSLGAVFRPFIYSKVKIVKQIEIAHMIEFERISAKMTTELIPSRGGMPLHFASTNVGYNPRFIVSSPTVSESFKFYIAGDAYAYLPLGSFFYTNPDMAFLPNGSRGYEKGNEFYSDRVISSSLKYGAGFSLGMKVNLSCNWNFHLEGNTIDIYSRQSSTTQITRAGIRGVWVAV